MSRDLETELTTRSVESGISVCTLRTVYLREMSDRQDATPDDALERVDRFIVYALVRDTKYAQDRDLVPSALFLSI